jgi:hypothetical protein
MWVFRRVVCGGFVVVINLNKGVKMGMKDDGCAVGLEGRKERVCCVLNVIT